MRDRVALITGGASGIGRAIGEALGRRGAVVVLADRQLEAAEAVADGIRSRGGRARAAPLDVRDLDAFRAVADELIRREGRIDHFFNNAGIAVGGRAEDYEDGVWDEVFDVNLRGVAHGVQAVYPHMRARGSGHIVNTASVAGLLPMPMGASYAATKHAVIGLTKALRIEAAVHGVRVSALCPGAIQTPILLGGKYGRRVGPPIADERVKAFWDKLRPMDPAAFATEVLADVEANEPYIVVPRWWKAVWLLERVSPRLSLRLWKRAYADQLTMFDGADAEPVPASGRRVASAE